MRPALWTIGVATAFFLIYGIAADSPSVNYYVPLTVVLVGVFALIHRSASFTDTTLLALALIGVGNLAGGVLLIDGSPLYELDIIGEIAYDKVFHFTASAVGGWAAYEAMTRWASRRGPVLVFAAVMMAAGGGAFVEVVEYVATLVQERTSVGGYDNNMQDLIANTFGAILGAVVARRADRSPEQHL